MITEGRHKISARGLVEPTDLNNWFTIKLKLAELRLTRKGM